MTTPRVSAYACETCHSVTLKHASACPRCKAWNTLRPVRGIVRALSAIAAASLAGRPRSLRDVKEAEAADRLGTGMPDFDRVLNAKKGAQRGAAILVSGDPGVGKTTLLLQALAGIARNHAALGDVLYVSAEESEEQIAGAASRLGAMPPGLLVMSEKDLDAIVTMVQSVRPVALVVDSLQRVRSGKLDSKTGSVLQVRGACVALVEQAKALRHVLFAVAHITKDGDLAGPKDVEHDVDTVLYFERVSDVVRKLHAAKNRLGSEAETAVFNMTPAGLLPVG